MPISVKQLSAKQREDAYELLSRVSRKQLRLLSEVPGEDTEAFEILRLGEMIDVYPDPDGDFSILINDKGREELIDASPTMY